MKKAPGTPTQESAFAGAEADRWFERNREAFNHRYDPRRDWSLRLIKLYGLKPRAALEIGAANGTRMNALRRLTGCRAVAADPSAKALADGRAKFPEVKFVRGLAHELAIKERFDLIICHFVLHWVDRRRLLETAAQIDRLLVDGGHLILGDFSPAGPCKVPYHHIPGAPIFTYKQNYSAIFTSSALYREVGILTGDDTNRNPRADPDGDDRISVCLLRKEVEGAHALRSLP